MAQISITYRTKNWFRNSGVEVRILLKNYSDIDEAIESLQELKRMRNDEELMREPNETCYLPEAI